MLLAEVGCVFLGFVLCSSESPVKGLHRQANSICALKGSSVDLSCPAERPTSAMKWYTVHWNDYEIVHEEISADGSRASYNMSEESNFTLTISDLRESDANFYSCRDSTAGLENSWVRRLQLHVADLQVKVIPSAEGNTVTLMCSTSCPLTGNPAAYIWYKNRQFLYQDWSPWYQQLVSSEEAATYSCAVRGYEELRAPQVSVDSVTRSCFSVTYAKGRMCSYKQTSEDEPCSITYPTEVHVQQTRSEGYITLNCTTSCPLTDPQTTYRWYQNGQLLLHVYSQHHSVSRSANGVSCAVNGHEDLLSAQVCGEGQKCWSVNYVRRRICALRGSSVNISSEYSYPKNLPLRSKTWYKRKRTAKEDAEELVEAAGRVQFNDEAKNQHILRIENLQRTDSGEYAFRLLTAEGTPGQSDVPGVTLVVTGVTVTFTPSSVVSEGHRVTVTCSTSCPLAHNTTYIWSLNGRPLTLPETQNKHLVLDPVSSRHAGNYVCAVRTTEQLTVSSSENTLTVEAMWTTMATINAARLIVALLIPVPLLVFHLWLRSAHYM